MTGGTAMTGRGIDGGQQPPGAGMVQPDWDGASLTHHVPPPPRRSVPRWVWVVAGGVVLVLVVGLVVVVRLVTAAPDLTPPATLGGRAVTTDPASTTALAGIEDEMRRRNTDVDVQGQAYGDLAATGDTVLLVNLGARLDPATEFAEFAASVADSGGSVARTQVGEAGCAVFAEGFTALCIRNGYRRSSSLLLVSATTAPTADQAAALLAEAWGD